MENILQSGTMRTLILVHLTQGRRHLSHMLPLLRVNHLLHSITSYYIYYHIALQHSWDMQRFLASDRRQWHHVRILILYRPVSQQVILDMLPHMSNLDYLHITDIVGGNECMGRKDIVQSIRLSELSFKRAEWTGALVTFVAAQSKLKKLELDEVEFTYSHSRPIDLPTLSQFIGTTSLLPHLSGMNGLVALDVVSYTSLSDLKCGLVPTLRHLTFSRNPPPEDDVDAFFQLIALRCPFLTQLVGICLPTHDRTPIHQALIYMKDLAVMDVGFTRWSVTVLLGKMVASELKIYASGLQSVSLVPLP